MKTLLHHVRTDCDMCGLQDIPVPRSLLIDNQPFDLCDLCWEALHLAVKFLRGRGGISVPLEDLQEGRT